MPVAIPIIVAAGTIAAVGSVAAGAIGAVGAQKAAKTQAKSQQAALDLQQQELEKKRAAGVKTVALKTSALEQFKLPGILETPEGKDLQARLRLRESGVGVGYNPEVLKAETAATAAQTRTGLKEQTIPAISAAASARGLGRSTIPVSQIGQASQAAERDIESRIAALTVTSENQRSVDIQNAITQQASLIEQQNKAKQAEAGTKLTGEFNIADTELGVANSNFQAVSSIGDLIRDQGTTRAASQLQQAALWAGAVQGAAGAMSNSSANDEIIKAIRSQKAENGARVNIAGFEDTTKPTQSYRLLPANLSM